jgi:hypothetical protein
MYAQIIFLNGLDCTKCKKPLFPHGRPTVGQVTDPQTGAAVRVPDAKSDKAKGRYLEARCKCGVSTRIVLDGLECRIERQATAPVVRDPVFLM